MIDHEMLPISTKRVNIYNFPHPETKKKKILIHVFVSNCASKIVLSWVWGDRIMSGQRTWKPSDCSLHLFISMHPPHSG